MSIERLALFIFALVVGMFIGGALITGNLDYVGSATSECFEIPIKIGE